MTNAEGIYKGTGTDNYVATSVTGEQSVVSGEEFEKNYMKVEFNGYERKDIREALMSGYPEMGEINLGISGEAVHSEDEAEQTTVGFVSKK